MKRVVTLLIALIMIVVCAMPSLAATKEDYTILKYATEVNDVDTNTVSVEGKGVMNNADPSEECGIIFKEMVEVKGFKATMRFDKSYGAGAQDGWYSINFNNKPMGVCSTTPTIKSKGIKGVNIIFKLNNSDKRIANLELSRYNGQQGFRQLYGQTIIVELNDDWIADVEIAQNGDLYICGNKVGELGDAIDLSFPDNKAYVGFIGFSENLNDVGFTVKYDAELTGQVVETEESEQKGTENSSGEIKNELNDEKGDLTLIVVIVIALVILVGGAGTIIMIKRKKTKKGV